MTTSLFVIANVKQLRTDGSFRILLPFFRTSWDVGFLNSAVFNSSYNRVDFGTILEGLRNFGRGEGRLNPLKTPLFGTPLLYAKHSVYSAVFVYSVPVFILLGYYWAVDVRVKVFQTYSSIY